MAKTPGNIAFSYNPRYGLDRGQATLLGVTSGVTLGPPFDYPGAIRLMRKVSTKAVFQPFHLSVADLNSSSYAELELADRESCIFR